MSEFTVCRTLDTHPALRYCLLLDDMRIAGGKPDYRGDNILISWRTKETYGPIDAIKTENSQLATEKTALERRIDELCSENERLRELADGAENEADRLTHDAAALQIKNAKLCAEVKRLRRMNAELIDEIDHLLIKRQHTEDMNAKLRELADSSYTFAFNCYHGVFDQEAFFRLREKYHDAGIEVPE